MSYTAQLHQLQKVDTQILAIQIRLREIDRNLAESEALKTARTVYDEAERQYKQTRATLADIDLEVKGLQQKIAQNETRLYSGKVTSPKEAGSLQDEVASSKRWLAKREEDLLEMMIQQEETEADYQKKQSLLSAIQSEWEAVQAGLLQEQQLKKQELENLIKTRSGLSKLINKQDLTVYERLRRKYRGVGLAEVKNGTCLACGVMVASRMVQQAQTDGKFYYCDNCQRIIHVL